jgi:hypothetical protein
MELENKRLSVNNLKRLKQITDWLYEELLPFLLKNGHSGQGETKSRNDLVPGYSGYESKIYTGKTFIITFSTVNKGKHKFDLFSPNVKYSAEFNKEIELEKIVKVVQEILK